MCQYKSEGGRRCPVHRHDSLAAINHVASQGELHSEQVQDLFIELRREGRTMGRGSTDAREWGSYLRDLKTSVSHHEGDTSTNMQNVRKAFDGAVNAPDKATFYALKNLNERATKRSEALKSELTLIASSQNRSLEKVRAEFEEASKAVDMSRGADVHESYTKNAVIEAQSKNLPSDRATIVALDKVRNSVERAPERRVKLEDVDSVYVKQAGCDPESGRVEIVYHAAPDNPSAYRNISPQQWETISDGFSQKGDGGALRQIIQGNPSQHLYSSQKESEADAHATRCDDCGQFSGINHDCPARGSNADAAPVSLKDGDAQVKPSEIVLGAIHVEFPDPGATEYVPTATAQRYPERYQSNAKNQSQVFTPEALGIDEFNNFAIVSKMTLAENLASDENADRELVKMVQDAPNDTVFGVNNYNDVPHKKMVDIQGRGKTDPSLPTKVVMTTEGRDIKFFNHGEDGGKLYGTQRWNGRQGGTETFTTEEDNAREEAALAHADELVERGEAVRIESVKSYSGKYLVDASLRDQPTVRFGKTKEFKETIKSGKTVIMDVGMKCPKMQAGLDDQGYERPKSFSMWDKSHREEVTGVVAMRLNKNNQLMEVDSEATKLKCSCVEYSKNYHCRHVDYAQRHMGNIGQQAIPGESRHSLLTAELSKNRNVKVVENGDGSSHISIGSDDIASNRTMRNYKVMNMVPIDVPDSEDVRNGLSRETVRKALYQYHRSQRVELVNTIDDTPTFWASVKQADTEVPLRARIGLARELASPVGPGNSVYGTVTFAKSDTDQAHKLSVKSHSLKCHCAEYQEKYDCEHVRITAEHAWTGFGSGDEDMTLDNSLARAYTFNSSTFSDEDEVMRRIAEDPSLDKDEVSAEVVNEREAQVEEDGRSQAAREQDAQVRSVYLNKLEESKKWLNRRVRKQNDQAKADYDTYRKALIAKWNNVEPGYSEDPEKFYNEYSEMFEKKDFDYKYSDVLDGSAGDGPGSRRFGVELEFTVPEGQDRFSTLAAIGADLREAGLVKDDADTKYPTTQERQDKQGWSFSTQGHEADGDLVSPMLKDDEKSWKDLETACTIIRKHGGTATAKAASPVQVSSGSYEYSSAKHVELTRSAVANEDLMYRLGTNPSKSRHRGTNYCSPNVVDAEGDVPANRNEGLWGAMGLPLNSLNTTDSAQGAVYRSNVEFRSYDSTLNPGIIQRQVKMSVAMVDKAERDVIVNQGSKKPTTPNRPLGSHYVKENQVMDDAEIETHTPETFMKANKDVAETLDGLFRKESDRRDMMQLFARTRWQRADSVPRSR